MAYNNFSISKKNSKFYLKEKQPTEGYVEVEYGTPVKKTYHKYFDTVQGTPKEFTTKEVEYQGRKLQFLEVSLEDGSDTNKISVSLKNKGGYTDEVKALVSAFNGYKVGETVTMTVRTSNYTTKKGDERENLNIYVNYDNIKKNDGKSESTGYIDYKEIPSPTKEDDGMGGIEWNWKPQTVFFYNKINEIEAKFGGDVTPTKPAAQTSKAVPTITPQEAFEPAGLDDEQYHDDLPF